MNETTDASAIFAPIWRRKWLILLVGLIVAVLAYLYFKREASVYQVSTQVYLANGTEEQSLLSNGQAKKTLNERAVSDQAALVNSTVVRSAVRARLLKEHDRAAFKGEAKAKAASGSDFIVITATAHNGKAAAKLANTYAEIYIARQNKTYRKEVQAAIAATHRERQRVERQGTSSAARGSHGKPSTSAPTTVSGAAALQVATLATREAQFISDLSVATVSQVSPALPKKAELIEPKPKQNAIFGFAIGILLASVAAYLLGRFDQRLRSLKDVEDIFKAPILAALPRVNHPIVHVEASPGVAAPLLEPLRRAHAALQLAEGRGTVGESSPHTLLLLSADAGDGRSTLTAGLALVQRDAGERVAVVEADFRRPVLAKLLDAGDAGGLAQVLVGKASIDSAMQLVAAAPSGTQKHEGAADGGGLATVVEALSGTASLLVCGGAVANPPALLGSSAMAACIGELRENFDSVLIDVPTPLEVSDALPLLQQVDGIVIVARLGYTRQTSARLLVDLLERSAGAPVLGVVANAVAPRELVRLGFSLQAGAGRRRGSLLRR